MANFLKRKLLRNKKGQTLVEYLLLIAVTFVIGYIVVTGPVSTFTAGMLTQIQNVTTNISRTGEMDPRGMSPTRPKRLKPVHLR